MKDTKYRLLATDLDGTLFDSDGRISEENLAAIHRLHAAGIPVVPATGRTYADLPPSLTQNDDIRYILHSNGAALYDKQTGERLLLAIPRAVIAAVMEVLRRYDVHLTVRAEGVSFVDERQANEQAYRRYNVCRPHAHILHTAARTLPDLAAWLSPREDTEMLCIFFRDESTMQQALLVLEGIPDIRVAEAAFCLLEVVHRTAGKGAMLRRLADRLGILHDATVAVGDSGNDLPLLADAGLALAVRGACPALRELADEVICSNEEHVVAYIARTVFGR